MAHKSAASFALSTELNKKVGSFKTRILAFGLFALMTPLGVLLGSSALSMESSPFLLLAPILNSMAAGTFLYIGTLHGLQEANLIRHCANLKEFFFMLIGFALMGIVAIWT
jgi:zinc transporter ZupT